MNRIYREKVFFFFFFHIAQFEFQVVSISILFGLDVMVSIGAVLVSQSKTLKLRTSSVTGIRS